MPPKRFARIILLDTSGIQRRKEEAYGWPLGLTPQLALVGRETELRFLRELLDDALAGKGRLVFIAIIS